MEDGLRFAIREGGRTVGAGVVAKVIAQDSTDIPGILPFGGVVREINRALRVANWL
jgi:hypothetical protein